MDRIMARISVETMLDSHEEDNGRIEGREDLTEAILGLLEDFLLDYTETYPSEEEEWVEENEEETTEEDLWT